MDTKLTLKLDNSIIELAKLYAKDNNISLSRLIENYLQAITTKKKKKKKIKISPLVESLTGVIDSEGNSREKYTDYLSEKYS